MLPLRLLNSDWLFIKFTLKVKGGVDKWSICIGNSTLLDESMGKTISVFIY